jgi:hypothetical protein
LAAAKAPPFRLPGEHFAAALVFLLVAAFGLVVIAPYLASGAYPLPRVVGVTHLLTLGWITTSIMGALYQFLPVALGEPVRSITAAHATFALWVAGVAAFVTGMGLGVPVVMLTGAAALGTGAVVFLINLIATLARATKRDLTWWALCGATVFLAVTLLLGVALAGNLRWGYLGASRGLALGTHLHIAVFGWVLLVIVGVAHRLLPMFLLSHGAGDRFAKAAVALLFTGAGTLTVGHHGPSVVRQWIPAALLAAGLLAFLLQALSFYRHRVRRVLDPGMRLAAIALSLLATTLALGAFVMFFSAPPHVWTGYVGALVLSISLFVAALYYKIVPFLVWLNRFGPLAGKGNVSRVADLYSASTATIAGNLMAIGTAALLLGVVLGSGRLAQGSALVLAAGVATVVLQMLALARRKP